jgi:ankyrin
VATNTGSTALHVAAHNRRYSAAVLLLDAGADVAARDRDSDTALHRAASNPLSVKMCKLLLSRGASLDARTNSGLDPETLARMYNQPENADFLADVRAAGGWSAYVAAPRNQLLALRRELPARRRTGPCRARAQAQLFLDSRIPDDVFMHVLTFWRSARDSAY